MIKFTGFRRFIKKCKRIMNFNAQRYLKQASMVIEAKMRELAPVSKGGKTRGGAGALRDSISSEVKTTEAVIGPNVPYAMVVEKGSKAHKIQGNPFLAFESGGAMVVVRSVMHPGTQPQPYVEPAMEQSTAEVNAIFIREMYSRI